MYNDCQKNNNKENVLIRRGDYISAVGNVQRRIHIQNQELFHIIIRKAEGYNRKVLISSRINTLLIHGWNQAIIESLAEIENAPV